MAKKLTTPKIGSKWKWERQPNHGRKVEIIVYKSYGTFILYTDLCDGEEIDLRVTSLKAWEDAKAGKRPYLSRLMKEKGEAND